MSVALRSIETADAPTKDRTALPATSKAPAVYNLVGQKLGRKGQATQARIVDAMLSLLAVPNGPPITLAQVAEAAEVKPANMYRYFPDLGRLVLAALDQVMQTAEAAFIRNLRVRWSDDRLEKDCRDFLIAHLEFWRKNARVLHMRNALADANDRDVQLYRNETTTPLIDLLAAQMNWHGAREHHECKCIATVMLTALERVATVMTNEAALLAGGVNRKMERDVHALDLISAEAQMMALTIASRRRTVSQITVSKRTQ
jgi:AcrR family transcriptional regulator